ncbi:MAG: hypothetical protein ACI87O_001613 [Planctomycetota bacterium]|jgi:hypothetical protein
MMTSSTLVNSSTETVIGIKLGDKRSPFRVLDAGAACVETGTVVTTPSRVEGRFKLTDMCRITIEAGGRTFNRSRATLRPPQAQSE